MIRMAIVGLCLLAIGCKSASASERAEIDALSKEKTELLASVTGLRAQNTSLSASRDALQGDLDRLHQDETVLRAEKEKRGVHYVLHCTIRQIHYSISLKKQLSDLVNEEKFDLVTDKESYDRAAIDSNLFESFRVGSAIFKGSVGEWRIKVEGKNVVVDP